MTDVRLKLSPPWVTYVNELNALFENDPDVRIEYDNDDVAARVYVEKAEKAAVIDHLLPDEVLCGNVTLQITVIPANTEGQFPIVVGYTKQELFDKAFEGNPVYAFTKTIYGIFNNPIVYVVFKNKVVQFFNDNLHDIYGNKSTLYQEIADDVFADLDGVFYCTDTEERVKDAPNVWP